MAEGQDVHSIFQNLWADYTAFNPRAKRIYDLILEREKSKDATITGLVNDHIALRTFRHPGLRISNLASVFERHGYEARGEYRFEEKKLFARHYEPSEDSMPKVFISELEVERFSPFLQKLVVEIAGQIDVGRVGTADFLWSGRVWDADYSTYLKFLEESEYAAWVYAFGFRANHFTISVNHLKAFSSLVELNEFVSGQGYELNRAGGVVKGAPEQLLEQSSTLAETAKVAFRDGEREVPACYYEFARRYPQSDGRLYQGFIAASADKIFESTNVHR